MLESDFPFRTVGGMCVFPNLKAGIETSLAAVRVGKITLNLYETNYTAHNGKRFRSAQTASLRSTVHGRNPPIQ
jgi:hypothetical protein